MSKGRVQKTNQPEKPGVAATVPAEIKVPEVNPRTPDWVNYIPMVLMTGALVLLTIGAYILFKEF